ARGSRTPRSRAGRSPARRRTARAARRGARAADRARDRRAIRSCPALLGTHEIARILEEALGRGDRLADDLVAGAVASELDEIGLGQELAQQLLIRARE